MISCACILYMRDGYDSLAPVMVQKLPLEAGPIAWSGSIEGACAMFRHFLRLDPSCRYFKVRSRALTSVDFVASEALIYGAVAFGRCVCFPLGQKG